MAVWILIEQPCAIDNIDAMEHLTRRFDIAIMADESLMGPSSACTLLKIMSFVRSQIARSRGGPVEGRDRINCCPSCRN